jgi:hypothetical protein
MLDVQTWPTRRRCFGMKHLPVSVCGTDWDGPTRMPW